MRLVALVAAVFLLGCTNVMVIVEQPPDAGDARPRRPTCDDDLSSSPLCTDNGGLYVYLGPYQCIRPQGTPGVDFDAPCLHWINGKQFAAVADCSICGPPGTTIYPPR